MIGEDQARGWLSDAVSMAEEAGEELKRGWRKTFRVEKKGRFDLVTEYDQRAQDLLAARVSEGFPDHRWVAEEGDARGGRGELTWFVDPLDGTTNFAHGHFFFGVSVGLAGEAPLLGVVHAPMLGTTWSGIAGVGAWRNGEPIRVSQTARLEDALVATGFPYDRASSEDNNLAEVRTIVPQVQGLRRCGSAAIDLCLVADGTYDGYWEQKLSAWDVCAGIAIARGAGAVVTDYRGRPAKALSHCLIVGNPALHPQLSATIQSSRNFEG